MKKTNQTPSKDQLLIKLGAAALNHRDQWMRVGKYPGMQAGVTLGSDGCGVVEEAGDQADASLVGQEVIINPNNNWGDDLRAQNPDYHILGMPRDGTFAEYIVVDQDRVHVKPGHLSTEQGAALPLGGLTAYRACFTHGKIDQNSNVLITGIGGGVALYALQFAVAKGAEVYVTSSSPDKLEKAKKLGASGGFNYKDENWEKEAASATGGVNVVIDSAGGDAINNYLKIVKPGGTIVFYGSTTGPNKGIDLFRMFWGQVSLQGSTMGNDLEFQQMVDFVQSQQLIPEIDSVRPFEQIISAMDEMERGDQMGKLVLSF